MERGEEDGEGEEEVDLSLLADRPEYQFADPTSNKPMGSERAYLKRREGELSIDEKKGEVNVITDPEGANTGSGLKIENLFLNSFFFCLGWFCEICQSSFKDSMGYLSHVNGKRHQRRLGYSMRVERSTLEEVQDKLEEVKEREEQAKIEAARRFFV